MALNMLTCGPVITILQNVSWAMPGRRAYKVRSSAALETSLDETTWVAVTQTDGQAEISAPFIRTTAASALVRLAQM